MFIPTTLSPIDRNRTCAKTAHNNVDGKLKQQEIKQGTALPKILVNWINSVK